MAFSTSFSISIALFLFISILVDGIQQNPPHPPIKIDCNKECSRRCGKSSRPKICIRACNTCCKRCNFVPPGTSGGASASSCYANMTTHGGRKKCP